MSLDVFSNLTKLPKNYKKYYNKFKNFTINVSIDGVGKKDEYIRRGTNFKQKDENVKQLLNYFNLNFCVTLSILNVGYQSDIIKYCSEYKKYPSFFNVLVEPFYLQISNLPFDLINFYLSKKQYHALFYSKQKSIEHFNLGIKFLKKYDAIHKTYLLDEWPEFEKYYE